MVVWVGGMETVHVGLEDSSGHCAEEPSLSVMKTVRVGAGSRIRGYFGLRVGILKDGAYPKCPWKALSETGSKYCVWLPRSYTKDVVF